ncbi:MAG: class I SAM-dependent methyltransferase [Saprospiraceae bacterium]|nr:class I SAM-dependent methyltransferase [Saprospiraceae bacterium]
MTIDEAREMLVAAPFREEAQIWLDLGCGSGKFTAALAGLLPAGSTVIGVDQHVQEIPNDGSKGVDIQFLQLDMLDIPNLPRPVQGILMANSLHYIEHKSAYIAGLLEQFDGQPQFIIVEYDMHASNQWVPYPMPFAELDTHFSKDVFGQVRKIGERPSMYRRGNLYAAHIR